jgi:uncharacterized membrane protein
MKKLRISATVSVILGSASLIALVFMFLALSDISNKEPDTLLEWKVVQFSWITLLLFVFSTFVTIGYIMKTPGIWERKEAR